MDDVALHHRTGRFLREHPSIAVGLFLVTGLLVAGYVAPLPYDPLGTSAIDSYQAPGAAHWFGTDSTGADVFSRTIRAARTDLTLALAGTLVSFLVGVPLGLVVSVKGPWGERAMRALDGFQAFPLLILALAMVSLSGNRLEMVVLAIALINVPRYMRLMRSEILSLRESRFVEAAVASGAGWPRIMRRHLLPNTWGVILAQTSITAAHSIVVIAALSFLGIGVQPPTPSWGQMIRSGASNMTSGEWWIAIFPGLAVFVAVMSLNLVADRLQDALGRTVRT
jgi:peptide/nickel transport system permease protein